MRRLPDSLFARLMIALLAVIGLTVTIAGVLIVRERQELAFWAGESQMTSPTFVMTVPMAWLPSTMARKRSTAEAPDARSPFTEE